MVEVCCFVRRYRHGGTISVVRFSLTVSIRLFALLCQHCGGGGGGARYTSILVKKGTLKMNESIEQITQSSRRQPGHLYLWLEKITTLPVTYLSITR